MKTLVYKAKTINWEENDWFLMFTRELRVHAPVTMNVCETSGNKISNTDAVNSIKIVLYVKRIIICGDWKAKILNSKRNNVILLIAISIERHFPFFLAD